MEQKKNKKLLWGIGIYLASFLLVLWIVNFDVVNGWLDTLLTILRPLLIGLIIAYLCNPIFNLFERKAFYKLRPFGLRRGLSLFCAYLVLVLIIVALLLLIFPQLIESIVNFIDNSDEYFENTCTQLNGLFSSLNTSLPGGEDGLGPIPYLDAQKLKDGFSDFLASLKLDTSKLLGYLNADNIGKLISLAGDVFTMITDILFGFFISLYLLSSKEKCYAQTMRYRRAFLSDQINDTITKICTTADKSFGGFIKGKLIDSAIIGVLVYIAISIFNVPYAILISVTVAITDIVPIIGPFVGVIPSSIIILLTDPAKVIPFLICILIIQQFDGNVLAPKVLGENTGISSMCVLIAITTMGALWGFVGMIIGVPLFATVLELTGNYLDKRLHKKGLSTATKDYYTPEIVDTAGASSPQKEEQEENMQSECLAQPIAGGQGDLSEEERAALKNHSLAKGNKTSAKKKQ